MSNTFLARARAVLARPFSIIFSPFSWAAQLPWPALVAFSASINLAVALTQTTGCTPAERSTVAGAAAFVVPIGCKLVSAVDPAAPGWVATLCADVGQAFTDIMKATGTPTTARRASCDAGVAPVALTDKHGVFAGLVCPAYLAEAQAAVAQARP